MKTYVLLTSVPALTVTQSPWMRIQSGHVIIESTANINPTSVLLLFFNNSDLLQLGSYFCIFIHNLCQ